MTKLKKSYPGLNVQHPISRLIINGTKTVETRTYPIPEGYIGQEMALVETPGKSGKFKSRVIGIVKFGTSFKYQTKLKFYADSARHCVMPDSPWAWDTNKGKWGWPVTVIEIFKTPKSIKKRLGIKFTKGIVI